MILMGLGKNEGELLIDRCPSSKDAEKLLKHKLAALRTPDKQEIEFALEWKQKRVDKWFRELIPKLFEFMDARYPENAPPELHWVLLGKHQRTVFVKNRPDITGEELEDAKGPANRNHKDHIVRIGEY